MDIYFTASIKGKKHYQQQYQSIIDILQKEQHNSISDHIMQTSIEEIRLETSEQRKSFHKKLDQWISTADAVIAEITFPSISVGFEISKALDKGKPVLALYSEGLPPSLLPELHTERLIIEKYTQATLNGIIQDFLRYVEGKHESKFTFFLSEELTEYLQKIAQKEHTSKSAYLRLLIEKDKTTNSL